MPIQTDTAATVTPRSWGHFNWEDPLLLDSQLSEDERSKLAAIENIGVVCLVYKLAKPVTGNFWLNIMDEEHAIPGLIEFSALRDFGDDHVVYAPYYMPIDNERWAWSDEALLDEAFEAIRVANPDITQADALKIQWGNGSVQMVPATQSTVSHTYTDGYSAHEISAWRAVHTRARGLPLRGTAPMGSSIPGSD